MWGTFFAGVAVGLILFLPLGGVCYATCIFLFDAVKRGKKRP